MGFIIFFDATLIAVFAFFIIALGYQIISVLHSAFMIIAIIIFAIQIILSICYISGMMKSRKNCCDDTVTSLDVFMTFTSSAMSMSASFLYLADLSFGYGTSFEELLYFIVTLGVAGVPWLFTLGCWTGAVCQEEKIGFNYWEFIKELLAFCVILFIYFVL